MSVQLCLLSVLLRLKKKKSLKYFWYRLHKLCGWVDEVQLKYYIQWTLNFFHKLTPIGYSLRFCLQLKSPVTQMQCVHNNITRRAVSSGFEKNTYLLYTAFLHLCCQTVLLPIRRRKGTWNLSLLTAAPAVGTFPGEFWNQDSLPLLVITVHQVHHHSTTLRAKKLHTASREEAH